MATLKTGDFSLRALPRVPQINPANFDARIGDLINTFGSAMQLPAQLERVRSIQRAGELERATQGQTIELAKQRAAQELELGPYRTAAEKRRATATLDQPGGDNLYYDEAGNLVKETVTIETDPITGEQFNVSVLDVVKPAEQVAQEREAAGALTTIREANARAAEERARAAVLASEAAMKRAERPVAGQRGRGVTREISDNRGNPVGVGSYEYDANGRLVRLVITPAARKDVATGQMIQDPPYEMPLPGQVAEEEAEPIGATSSGNVPFKINMPDESNTPASVPAVPVTAAPAGKSPATPAPVATPARMAEFPNRKSLLDAARAGTISFPEAAAIAKANGWD